MHIFAIQRFYIQKYYKYYYLLHVILKYFRWLRAVLYCFAQITRERNCLLTVAISLFNFLNQKTPDKYQKEKIRI